MPYTLLDEWLSFLQTKLGRELGTDDLVFPMYVRRSSELHPGFIFLKKVLKSCCMRQQLALTYV